MTKQKFICPAVSVVIPLYNVEKYVGECLDSLLAQTFQNFEVIVADDCSTDSSPAVVESYASKFGGRLKLTRMKKNSGSAGSPRNRGIELSCGEYLYFMDPDDAVTPTALEELYTLAKKYDADVVHCEKWYEVPDKFWHDDGYRKSLKPSSWPAGEKIFITTPTLLTEDFALRVTEFSKRWLTWGMGIQFVRRNFIIETSIKFANLPVFEDCAFTICEICSAKKYLVVPNVIYFYRQREGSAMHSRPELSTFLHKELSSLKKGVRYLNEFLSEQELFAQRPDLKYALFDMFVQEILGHLINIYVNIPMFALDELLQKEFSDDGNIALNAFVFSSMNVYRLKLLQAQQRIAALEKRTAPREVNL